MMPRLRSILRDQSGAAAVEFAVLTTTFFFAFLGVLDFGFFFIAEQKLGQVVSAAAVDAFDNRNTVGFANIPAYVQNAAGAPSTPTVTVVCNGTTATACTNTSRTCSCINSSGTYAAATCGSTCSGTGYSVGQTAGYYMKITASYTLPGLVVPSNMMKNANVARSISIRLQ